MDNQEDIFNIIVKYFSTLYSKEDWDCPLFNNLDFACIGTEKAQWLEMDFVKEVRKVVFDLVGDKLQVWMDSLPFFQLFWDKT